MRPDRRELHDGDGRSGNSAARKSGPISPIWCGRRRSCIKPREAFSLEHRVLRRAQCLARHFYAPPGGSQSLSFLGIDFGSDIVSRVEITIGNTALGPNEGAGINLLVMDDFIYGEPVAAVSEPSTVILLFGGLLGLS